MEINEKYQKLCSILRSYEKLIVAYSGGVDSAFLMKVSYDILGENALAVLAISPSLAKRELDSAIASGAPFRLKFSPICSSRACFRDYQAEMPATWSAIAPLSRCIPIFDVQRML